MFILIDFVNKCNNTVHITIKMKPIDVTNDSLAEYDEESNKKSPKFKINDHVKISKYKNIFAKEYVPNWSEEIFIVSTIKINNDLNGNEIKGIFMKKNCKRLIQKSLE